MTSKKELQNNDLNIIFNSSYKQFLNNNFTFITFIICDNNKCLFIDIIYTEYKDAKELLHDFDLPICQVRFKYYNSCQAFLFADKQCLDNKECNIYSNILYDFFNIDILQNIKGCDLDFFIQYNNEYIKTKYKYNKHVSRWSSLYDETIYDMPIYNRIKKYENRGFKINILKNTIGKKSVEEKQLSRYKHMFFYYK